MDYLTSWFFPEQPSLNVFSGKRALYTGCATGLGREAVLQLAEAGCRLALVDLNEKALEEVAEECRRLYPGPAKNAVTTIVTDLSEPGRSTRIVRTAVKALGGLDYLFLNHLGSRGGTKSLVGACFLPSMPLTDETLSGLITTNMTTSIALIRDAMPFLMDSKGSVVFTASSGAQLRLPFLCMYSFMKQGMVAFLESLRQEMKLIEGKEVCVTICYLNAVGTETFHRQVGKEQPIRIEAPPEQVSSPRDAALFILRSAAAKKEDAYGPLPGLWIAKTVANLFPTFIDGLTRRIPAASADAKTRVVADYDRIRASIAGSGGSIL